MPRRYCLARQHQRLRDAGIQVRRIWRAQSEQGAVMLLEPIPDAQMVSIRTARVFAVNETPTQAGSTGTGKMKFAYLSIPVALPASFASHSTRRCRKVQYYKPMVMRPMRSTPGSSDRRTHNVDRMRAVRLRHQPRSRWASAGIDRCALCRERQAVRTPGFLPGSSFTGALAYPRERRAGLEGYLDNLVVPMVGKTGC